MCPLPPCTNDGGRYSSPNCFIDSYVDLTRPGQSTAPILVILVAVEQMYLGCDTILTGTTFAIVIQGIFIYCVRGTATHIFSHISKPSWKKQEGGSGKWLAWKCTLQEVNNG